MTKAVRIQCRRRRRRSWRRVVLWLTATALLAPVVSCHGMGEPVAIRLDVRPFTDPLATFVQVRADGEAAAIRYSASARIVTAVHRGHLAPDRTRQLLAVAEGPDFRRAISCSWKVSSGTEHGDLYELTAELSDGAARRAGGFRHDAPAGVDAWIEELLGLARSLPEVAGEAAYLRAAPLSADKLTAIRRRGLLKLGSIETIPSGLRPLVHEASKHWGDFRPISRHHYSELVALANHGKELLIVSGGEGLRLSPYAVRNRSSRLDLKSHRWPITPSAWSTSTPARVPWEWAWPTPSVLRQQIPTTPHSTFL